jgi:hypothetical protein
MFINDLDTQRNGQKDTANYEYGYTFTLFLNAGRPVRHNLP